MLLTYLRTIIGYLLILLVALCFFVPAVLLAMLLPAQKRYHSRALFWLLDKTYKGVIRCMFVPYTVEGREHIPQNPAIFVANHESVLDIPVLGSLMNKHPHVWFVLERFARAPILGAIVQRMFIPVDQSCSMKSARALIQGIRTVEQHQLHTIIFPEGGRYIDGTIHEFYEGFAILAQRTKQPVVPVMISNLGKIYPPGSFLVHYYPCKVVIGEPIVMQDGETTEQFTRRVRAWFLQHVS